MIKGWLSRTRRHDPGSGSGQDARNTSNHFRGDVAVRLVAGVVSVVAGGSWLMCAIGVLRSRFATDAAFDPHGYALISGTLPAVPAGLVCALTLPFAVAREGRARAFGIVIPSFVVASVLLVVALLTA
jgi:hypothetical protein